MKSFLSVLFVSLGCCVSAVALGVPADSTEGTTWGNGGGSLLAAEAAVQLQLTPLLFGGFDRVDRLILLPAGNSQPTSSDLPVASQPPRYRFIQKRRIDVGFGGTSRVGLSVAPDAVGVFASVFPVVGGAVLADRALPEPGAVTRMPSLRLPRRGTDLRGWRPTDRMVFVSRGGVVVSAGATAGGIVGAAVSYLAEGEWLVSIHKETEDFVTVEYTKSKVTAFSKMLFAGIGGVNLVSCSQNEFSQFENMLYYGFSLKHDLGLKAYEKAINGDFRAVENLLAEAKSQQSNRSGESDSDVSLLPIQKRRQVTSWGTSSLQVLRASLPLLVARQKMAGTTVTVSHQSRFSDNSVAEGATSLILAADSTSGVLSNHALKSNQFIATAEKISLLEKNGEIQNRLHGKYQWVFEQDQVSSADLAGAARIAGARLGMKAALLKLVPSRAGSYGRFEASVEWGDESMQELLALSRRDDAPSLFQDATQGVFTRLWQSDEEAKNALCREGSGAFARVLPEVDCAAVKGKEHLEKTLKVLKMLKDLDALAPDSLRARSQAMAQVVALATSSPVVLHGIAGLLSAHPLTVRVGLLGSRFAARDQVLVLRSEWE